MKIVSLGIIVFVLLDIILAARLRSIPGSSILSPREIFAYTSCESRVTDVYFHNTAIIRSIFDELIPRQLLFGSQNFVYVVRLSVSIIIGRVHSIVIDREDPIVAS
jgi:hypothetical protein